MTKYEYYQLQKNFCETLGKQPHINEHLRTFYKRAAIGFEKKINRMTISEAEKRATV
jgi:hypothetical protein